MRAVALVDVDVDHEHTSHTALGAEVAERRDHVVEDAVATPDVGERMVRPAAEVARDAVVERGSCGHDRRAGGASRALDELGRPGQPERELLAAHERAVADALDPVAAVGSAKLLPARGLRRLHVDPGEPLGRLADEPVLGERESGAPRGAGR